MENETTEQHAIRIIYAIRQLLGSDVKGVSPDQDELRDHGLLEGMDTETYIAAARYADSMGWVRVRDAIGKPAFSIVIMEAGQQYLDDFGV